MRTLNLFLLFFFLFALNSYSLPQCEGDDTTKWNNCYGTYTFASGAKYVGGYKDGKKHGKGTYTFADGSKYVGGYKDGGRHGKGTMFDSTTGESQSGKWKDDKPYGRQVIVNY